MKSFEIIIISYWFCFQHIHWRRHVAWRRRPLNCKRSAFSCSVSTSGAGRFVLGVPLVDLVLSCLILFDPGRFLADFIRTLIVSSNLYILFFVVSSFLKNIPLKQQLHQQIWRNWKISLATNSTTNPTNPATNMKKSKINWKSINITKHLTKNASGSVMGTRLFQERNNTLRLPRNW